MKGIKPNRSVKLRYVAPLAIAAGGLAIVLAPVAAAATVPTNPNVTQNVTPGNAEITTSPGATALNAGAQQYPFWGGNLLFHNSHGGHR